MRQRTIRPLTPSLPLRSCVGWQIMSGRDAPILDISDVEPELLEGDIFSDIWTSSGIKDYERDGTRYLLAHSSITEPAGYTVLIFIPEDEASGRGAPAGHRHRAANPTPALFCIAFAVAVQ